MRRHILLWLQFCGTAYHGFQVQANAVTVSQTLQDAIEKVCGVREEIKGCSRTDAGVHAAAYAVSFFTDSPLPLAKLPLALNAHLPADIRAVKAEQVAEDFHARYSAKTKTYLYRIRNSPVDSPFERDLSWRVNAFLDEAAMQRAADRLVGTHDFAGFMSANSAIELAHGSTVRTVTRAEVTRRGEEVLFFVTADGYLYNMVRIMAGTLVQAGLGQMTEQEVQRAVDTAERRFAGPTAPAKGLFLYRIEY